MSQTLKIAMLAALPDECRRLKKVVGRWRSVSRRPFRSFRASVPGKEAVLIETGMGGARALSALEWTLSRERPDLICSFGFAGGLSEEIQAGEVFLASSFRAGGDSGSFLEQDSLRLEPSASLTRFCDENGIKKAGIVSVARGDMSKPEIARLADGSAAMIDMESFFAAGFALKERIPFVCFRAISDALEDEIDFDPAALTDSDGRVSALKAVLAMIAAPRLVGSFYKAWERSGSASKNLCSALARFLELPSGVMKEMTERSVLMESLGRNDIPQ